MSYILSFECDGLTEEERDIVLAKLDIIKFHVFKDLNVKYTMLHRANRISINQEINDINVAFECFKLLSSFNFDKEYDDWYNYGEDSNVTCSLVSKKSIELEG